MVNFVTVPSGTKICSKCERRRKLVEFPPRTDSKEGIRDTCRYCTYGRTKRKRPNSDRVQLNISISRDTKKRIEELADSYSISQALLVESILVKYLQGRQ